MSSLFNQVATGPAKTAYQTYTIKHGIEKISVLVPLIEAPAFEQQFNKLGDRSKSALLKLVESFKGKVRS